MSKEKKESSPGSSIGVGLLCLVIGGICLYYGYAFWGWFLLAIGTYGLVSGILQPRFGKDRAANIGTIPTILVIITGLYIHFVARTNADWVLASSGASIAALATVAGYGLFSSFKSGTIRVVLKSLAIVAFSAALVFIFHFWARKVFLLNAILLFMATGSLRQGLYELLTGRSEQSIEEAVIYFVPDIFVLVSLVGGLVYYRDLLFFHLFVITLVLGLFRFSTERFISEIAIREHQKIDADHPRQRRRFSFSFFASLTDVHASINLLMLPVLLGYLGLSLEQYVVKFEIQSDVFQASIGLLGIVAGFSTLILEERLRKGDEGWAKQTYLLRGLVGITFLFFFIASIAFVGLTLKSVTQQSSLPSADVIVAQFLANSDTRIQVVAALANEFILFAIPAALLYFFSLSRDLLERYERDN